MKNRVSASKDVASKHGYLRQAIEMRLDKVELTIRFTGTVAGGNPREFTQTGKEEHEIAEACTRTIKNSIICWNNLYLARQL